MALSTDLPIDYGDDTVAFINDSVVVIIVIELVVTSLVV